MLVVAARQKSELPEGVNDSKKLTKRQRGLINISLLRCCDFGEGWVSSSEIDGLGLTAATKLGVSRALLALGASADEQLIIDGHINYAPDSFKNVKTLVRADSLVPIVSAASIYAKVTRDDYMLAISKKYPGYGFENHVGYGTVLHLSALSSLGVVKSLHRLSFAPLKYADKSL